MKIAIYSEWKHKLSATGWFRGGEDIRYEKYCADKRKLKLNSAKSYYSLSFTYTFEHDNDVVSFAFSEPYTYAELQTLLSSIKNDEAYRNICEHKVLCTTISGLKCDLLRITSPDKTASKRSVVLTARVHPGETVGSWMMKGVTEFLLSARSDAEYLRNNCVFYVVPMLNPDGVMQGNYRCSLSGNDLNRKYALPSKTFHPEIFHLKALVQRVNQEMPLLFYCDLHGHSKK